MNSLGRKGLVGNISKGLGHIHSSVNLPRADEALCMTDVDRGKLGRTTTKGLREMRAIFRAKLRDCANAINSGSCNMASCIARIKQGEDMVLASR